MQLSRGRLLLLAGLIIPYVAFLAWYHCPYAAGSDSSGYMNSAKLLLEGKFSMPVRAPAGLTAEVLPRMYLYPLGFRLDPTEQNMLPTYPVGLPLHYAAAGLLVGLDHGATLVGILSALAFAGLLYLTAREFGVAPNWSAAVALLGALSPLTVQYALQVMSDLVAAAWTLAVILFALRASRHAGWAFAAGVALAVAVLVRPANLLLLLPAAVALPPRIRTWIAFGLGGLPGALFLAGYNHSLYGSYFASGYGDVGRMFALRHLLPTLWHYAIWVPVLATPFVLAAAALPWLKIDRRKKLTLVAWAGSLFIFYAFYECTQEIWWYLRFILPALPALMIAAALRLQEVSYPTWFLQSRLLPAGAPPEQVMRGRILRLPVLAALLLASVGWMLAWDRGLKISQTELNERTYPLVGRWVNEQMPANAILAVYQVSGAILYHTDRPFINPVNLIPADYARLNAWLEKEHRPLYAVLYPFEEENALQRMPGRWEVVTRIRQATVWRRVGPAEPPAITLREVTVDSNGRGVRISLLLFPVKNFQIRVIDNPASNDKARFQTLTAAMESLDSLAGCNGGFFERTPFSPVGLMVSGGQRYGRLDSESWMKGLLVVRGGVATLEPTTTFQDSPEVTELIQSGPWLVRSGLAETDNSRTQLAKRTFICHDTHGNWAIGASGSCTLSELAAVLKSAEVTTILDIQSALNLDGGPSTGLWLRRPDGNFYLPERGPVRNYVAIVPSSPP